MKKEYNTKINQEILTYINEEKEGSFTTKDVYDYLLSKNLQMNLTTIYRNLEKLVKKNTLVKFKSSKSDSNLYRVIDTESNCHRHLHLQCKMCGKIYHLKGTFMEDIDNYIKNEFNFTIDCQNSLLSGICYECSKKNSL